MRPDATPLKADGNRRGASSLIGPTSLRDRSLPAKLSLVWLINSNSLMTILGRPAMSSPLCQTGIRVRLVRFSRHAAAPLAAAAFAGGGAVTASDPSALLRITKSQGPVCECIRFPERATPGNTGQPPRRPRIDRLIRLKIIPRGPPDPLSLTAPNAQNARSATLCGRTQGS
jgi:hypothetical protein